MGVKNTFSVDFTLKIAELSKLSLTTEESTHLAEQFNNTLKVVEALNKLDTSKTDPAYNITGLKNVFREDDIDSKRQLTQEQALLNAKRKHNGFFVVNNILDEK